MGELLVKREGAVGTLLFSNVARHNAMSYSMWHEFPERLQELDTDPNVRVIVLAGDGDKAFVSGADISQFKENRAEEGMQQAYDRALVTAFGAPSGCEKPVIAKIRGFCMGGGLGIAAGCDIRICSNDAVFRMPAARMGLGYPFPSAQKFVALIGVANAADIFFTARRFDATEAQRMGFVQRVTSIEDLDAAVAEYCAMIAGNAPLAVASAKRSIIEAGRDENRRDMNAVMGLIEAASESEDHEEASAAFMEKREPVFKGR
ncbi:MAG: enoyl-CoA hydratase [Burkholderiales bacterium]